MYHYIEKWKQDLDQGKKVCTIFKSVWYCTSQFITCQTKEKLFVKMFSKGKYKQQIQWTI